MPLASGQQVELPQPDSRFFSEFEDAVSQLPGRQRHRCHTLRFLGPNKERDEQNKPGKQEENGGTVAAHTE